MPGSHSELSWLFQGEFLIQSGVKNLGFLYIDSLNTDQKFPKILRKLRSFYRGHKKKKLSQMIYCTKMKKKTLNTIHAISWSMLSKHLSTIHISGILHSALFLEQIRTTT